ncbi:MAG: sulfur carrier protein ThiS [Deltaproteobacteria bacterium]|nr:sulfur carrier protein ThiS [Deltaproteobacteria bacterium]
MNLVVNGKETSVDGRETLSISQLLVALNVADPLYVTVELNGDIQERSAFEQVVVRGGDKVEFLYFMGGGR